MGPAIVLALAQICVNEAGWHNLQDCRAIYAVLETRRPRSQSMLDIMHLYATNVFNTERQDRRRWIPHLNLEGTEPEGWPSQRSWERERPRWLRVISNVRRILTRRIRRVCIDPRTGERTIPDHWGAPHYREERLRAAGWTLLNCGNTSNWFWKLP